MNNNKIRLFLDLDGTLARFNVRNAMQRFDNEVGFFAKLLAYKGIEEVNDLANRIDLFVISASPNEQADKDKMQWIKKHLPSINASNVVLCRIGQNKAQVIEEQCNIIIDEQCYLLDDYTKNLIDWENNKGKGIKRLTRVADNSTHKWKGLAIKQLKDLVRLIDTLETINS